MRNKLTLEDVEWKEFRIKDIFEVSGTITTHPSKLNIGGKTPRITCAATNNGLDDTYDNLPTEIGGVLTVDSATDGYISYQGTDFIATDHVEKIALKDNKKMNRYVGLFLKTAITKNISSKYGYGYKFSQKRINTQIIMLPVDENYNPHWRFMEDYIKQEQKEISSEVVKYYQNKLNEIIKSIEGGALQPIKYKNVNWKVFEFSEIFREIKRGKRLTKANQKNGTIPYISSSGINNGVDNFISNDKNVRKFENSLSIANSGSVGSTFYHKYEYIASDHITSLQLENADENIYLFMATMVKRLEEKYSFNREINDKRIQREKLILPVDKNGNPNFKYMQEFVLNMQKKNIEKTLEYIYIYIISTIIEIYKNKYSLSNIEWKEFFIEDIFEIKSGVRLTKADQIDGKLAFIGSTDSNNGITEFVSNKNKSLDKNILGVNYNGSVGETFYHSYDCIFSDDVKRLKLKELKKANKWVYLFCKQSILQQKNKYRYGYKFNANRMKRQIILLPVNDIGKPNYNFMENYIKFREFKKYTDVIKSNIKIL